MIEFKHVNKKYPNGFEALKDIDLTIGQGEFVAIIGLSGAGKSTLIRTINRMHDITNGTLTVDGTDVMQLHGKSLRAFRRRIGMIFQSFNLVTRTTVIKNVLTAFVPELPWWRAALGIFTKAEKTAALEALDKVGILDKAFVRADQLSGGQQQRVALARALVITPDVLLMDEPLSNLDAKLRLEMRSVIRHTQKDVGITTVYVTHDQEEAMAISDTIAVMKDGVIQHVGTPKDIYQRPKNVFVATFIGRTNIIPALVENGAIVFGNGYRVEMDCLRQTAGQEVLCSVRPEEFVISPDGTEGISGVVKEYTYLGLNTHYFVETDDGQKTVEIVEESSIEDELKPGQRVLLQVKKHKINVFNKEGSVNLVRSEAFYEG